MIKSDNAQWLQGRSIEDIDYDIADWGLLDRPQEDIFISAYLENKYIKEGLERYG